MVVPALLLALTVAAIGYTFCATIAVRRFALAARPTSAVTEPVTLLKPLHGAEPRLSENLASFMAQDWPAPMQMVVGTNAADDPALVVARAVAEQATVRAGAPPLGSNAKIANLANMLAAAAHDLLVLSDSDIAVPPDYLARVAAALAQPGVGAVTCLYRGRGDAGRWSRLAAAAISYQFLPSVATSFALGVDHPCMGSTIALRRDTLARIGGFEAFAEMLADDHALGAAVRALGWTVPAVPGLIVTHDCAEASVAAVWRHELRWSSTLRIVNPAGHAASILTHPLPLALLIVPFWPLTGAMMGGLAVAARILLARTVDRAAGTRTAPLTWLPLRDLASFGVFLASFVARSVDWRGHKFKLAASGRIVAEEIP